MLESDFNIDREHKDISFQDFFHSLEDVFYGGILCVYLFSFSFRIFLEEYSKYITR